MKILCITTQLNRPSSKYRLQQYVPYLSENGVQVELLIVPKGVKRVKFILKVKYYDCIFIQKKLFSRIEQYLLSLTAKKIIFDYDDAIMFTKSKYGRNTRRYKRFCYMTKIADTIIAGNKYLAEQVPFAYKDKVEIVPTVINVNKYPIHLRRGSEITIGWIGTRSTQQYLKIVESVLNKLCVKYSNVKVKIVSDQKPGLCNDNIEWEKWDAESEIDQLLCFDIGIMPLSTDSWTKGKCGFKLLQYMSAGIPVVCSPVGVNKEIVEDGVNGFWASDAKDWEKAISGLVDNKDLYDRISKAGRQTVEKKYNLSVWNPRFTDIIKR